MKPAVMLLTIFTPTYNRAYTLTRTYESLCRQKTFDFEWIVVDDGSADETGILISKLSGQSAFPVRYFRKDNGGKHTAYNIGLQEARGEFFFDLDSDDWLPDDFLDILIKKLPELRSSDNTAGVIGMKADIDGKFLGRPLPEEYNGVTYQGIKTRMRGEYSFIFKTKIATKFRFPVLEHERFMPESVVYDRYDGYEFLISDKVMTYCEYQPDGLSHRYNHLIIENPMGYRLYHYNRMRASKNLFEKIIHLLNVGAFTYIAFNKKGTYIKSGLPKSLDLILHPVYVHIANAYLKAAGNEV